MSDKIQVTPLQMLTLMTFEAQANQLAFASAQLKGQGCEEASAVLRDAASAIMGVAERMKADWLRTIQVVPAGAVPRLVQP